MKNMRSIESGLLNSRRSNMGALAVGLRSASLGVITIVKDAVTSEEINLTNFDYW